MKKENSSSILNEALADYNKIIEAASIVAKKKLVDENQTKYNALLNEAINNKINNINDNEVDAEITDTTIQNETDMSKETNQAKKVSHPIGNGAPFNNKAKGVDETVTIQDTVGDTDPFNVKTKGNKIVDETVTIQDTVGDDDPFNVKTKGNKTVDETVTIQNTVGDTDPFNVKTKGNKTVDETVTIQNTVGKTTPFTEKPKGVNKAKPIEENFNLSEYDITNTQEPSNGFSDDEFSFEDIEAEINELENFDSEMGNGMENDEVPAEESNDEVIEQLKAMKSQLDSILAGMGVTDEVEPEANDMDDLGTQENGELDEISNDLVANASRGMVGYGQHQRGDNLRNNQVDIDRLFPTGNYIAGDSKIAGTRMSPDMKRAMIFLKREDEENGEVSLTIQYDSAYDKFQIPPGIEFNREEARRLGQLASKINPNSQYKTGTKDLPVDGYMEENYEENKEPITDDDINSFLNGENDIEEGLGISHATNKISTARNPRPEFASSPAAAERRRPGFVQENKRISGLVEQNKNLTKRINEMKKTQESAIKLAENYKTALGKYKNQLMEMAIFNTNLAHVNNLFVNEAFELTHEDKVKIINEFKTVNTLTESENKYNTLLTEMKTSKQSIVESVEKKLTTSMSPSSKQVMNEVIEKTVYNSNSGIDKIKRTMNYIENKR